MWTSEQWQSLGASVAALGGPTSPTKTAIILLWSRTEVVAQTLDAIKKGADSVAGRLQVCESVSSLVRNLHHPSLGFMSS